METNQPTPKPEVSLTEYNEKGFLLPGSILSMVAYHAKVYPHPRGEYQLRISDCNQAIKLWGKLDNKKDAAEAYEKLNNLILAATRLRDNIAKQAGLLGNGAQS